MPIAPCARAFSHALSQLQVTAKNSDWLIVLLAPFVIGWSDWYWICDSHLKTALKLVSSTFALMFSLTPREFNSDNREP